MNRIDGKPVDLSKYQGRVVLMVNVASQCGFTYQYEGLQALFKRYESQGFMIAGFPANNFGGQEPGSNEEIGAFCKSKFGVTFPDVVPTIPPRSVAHRGPERSRQKESE